MNKEASARIKINKLLEEAGWSFFDSGGRKVSLVRNHLKPLTHVNPFQSG